MSACDRCQQPTRTEILPSHDEDLGGVRVRLINSVIQQSCDSCGEAEVIIPNLPGLIGAAAAALVTLDFKLNGREIRFLRKVIDLPAKEFAKKLEVRPETVSRWETGQEVIGPSSEKLLRIIVGLVLSLRGSKEKVDIMLISDMHIRAVKRGKEKEPLCFELKALTEEGVGDPHKKWSREPARKAA